MFLFLIQNKKKNMLTTKAQVNIDYSGQYINKEGQITIILDFKYVNDTLRGPNDVPY